MGGWEGGRGGDIEKRRHCDDTLFLSLSLPLSVSLCVSLGCLGCLGCLGMRTSGAIARLASPWRQQASAFVRFAGGGPGGGDFATECSNVAQHGATISRPI